LIWKLVLQPVCFVANLIETGPAGRIATVLNQTDYCQGADINRSGDVDWKDVAVLLARWLEE